MAAISSTRGTRPYPQSVLETAEKQPLPTIDKLMHGRNTKKSNRPLGPRASPSYSHAIDEDKVDDTKKGIREAVLDDHQSGRLVLDPNIRSRVLKAGFGKPEQLRAEADEKSGEARNKSSKRKSRANKKLAAENTKRLLQDPSNDVREAQKPSTDNLRRALWKQQLDFNTSTTNSSALRHADATDPSEKASKISSVPHSRYNSKQQLRSTRQRKQKSKVKKAANPGQASREITGRAPRLSPASLNSHPPSSLTNIKHSGFMANNTSLKPTTSKALLNSLTNPKQDTLLQEAMSASMRSHGRGVTHPQLGYKTTRSRKLLDPNKFEIEPLPRENRGFQPRGYSQTSEAASSVTAEQHPRTFTSSQAFIGHEPAVQPHFIAEPAAPIGDSRASPTIENSDLVKIDRVTPLATNARKANQVPTMAQSGINGAKTLTIKGSNAGTLRLRDQPLALMSLLPEDPKVLSNLDDNGGLEASMWANPQKDLSKLPGLRPHPTDSPKWDSTNGYTAPTKVGGRYSINVIPKYAYNNGVKPKTTNKLSASTNGITVPPQEIRSEGTISANTTTRPSPNVEYNTTVVVSQAVTTALPIPVPSALTQPPNAVAPGMCIQSQTGEQSQHAKDNSSSAQHVPSYVPTQEKPAGQEDVPPHLRIPEKPAGQEYVAPDPRKQDKSADQGYVQPHIRTQDMPADQEQVPPHLRTPKTKTKKLALLESQHEPKHQIYRVQVVSSGGNDEAGKPENKGAEVISLEGKASEAAANGPAETLVADNGKLTASAAAPHTIASPKSKKSGKEKTISSNGWDKPIQTHDLLGWDGARVEPHYDWEGRPKDKIPIEEQLQRLEHWSQANELEASQSIAHVDTTSPEFMQGAGVADDGSLSNVHSEDAHRTHRLPNDPLTLAKADLTTQSVVEKLNAKRREEVTEPSLTKQERRDLRAAFIQRNKDCADLPNPYKPAADIFIRSAKAKDLHQITQIYNYFIKTSAVALELDPMTHDQWRTRMEDCRDEGYDMYVAVQKTANGNGNSRRDSCEPIFGFAYAEDQNDRRSSCRFAAVAQVYVNWKHFQVGVGRCLLDRVMAMLNVNHFPKQGVEWVGEKPSVQREIKKVLIEIPYWDDSEEERAIFSMVKNEKTGQMDRVPGWKAKWLESVQFEYESTLRGIGFKKAGLDKGKTVSIATFMLDTFIDISKTQDQQ